MPGRPPKAAHVRDTFLAASSSASDLVKTISGLSGVNPNSTCPRLHAEQARRVVELAFLGLVSAWEEFLEQSFVRYLAGAKADNDFCPELRMGKATDISHAYQIISGDPNFDPSRNYAKFGEPKWVISISKNYFALGAPYATVLQPNIDPIQHSIKLRNRVAHNSSKCREDFIKSAKIHLNIPEDGKLRQGYTVGDLLAAPADRLFGQEARNKGWTYFQAYNARFRAMARKIVR
ncbi:hypothetical protein [Rhodanobacter sp. BL-MT-08]